jgi:hypothetical protein
LIKETIDIWKSIEDCNCNKEDKLDCDRKGKESQDNPSDDEHMELMAIEDEEFV